VRYLFDTQLVIWTAYQAARLPRIARELLDDVNIEPVLSVVAIWEVAIKAAKYGDFSFDPHVLRSAMLRHGWQELPVIGAHALAVVGLPPLHSDPFDRLMLAQALAEGMTFVTTDRAVARYPGPVRLV
jgi:PIN domain nuclease of toxin-antitoxin system